MSMDAPIPRDWKNPNWNIPEVGAPDYNWKYTIPEEVVMMWDTFTDPQRKLLAQWGQQLSDELQYADKLGEDN